MSELFDANRYYRRGVVLGLSLAELFTVLVFLLLLVLGAQLLIQDETLARTDALVDDQRDVLVTLAGDAGTAIEAALPEDLRLLEHRSALMRVGKENRDLRDQLATRADRRGGGDKTQVSGELVPAQELKRQQDAIDALTRTMAAMQERLQHLADSDDETVIETLETELERLKQANEELSRQLAATADLDEVLEEVDTLNMKLKWLEQENAELHHKRELVADLKGQDSPCWFRPSKRANGVPYERALYIFDVLIDDDDIFVQDVPAPGPAYEEQKSSLPFDRNGLNRSLTDDEFLGAFEPLKRAAENREVRTDRRCTFYVAVWDATSETNKRRYKRAHNQIVQAIFNTYEYVHAGWPH